MTNFLEETKESITQSGHRPEQITFIGSRDGEYGFTFWSDFEKLADFDYDSSYGGQHIASDLVVVFDDGSYLERGEYDGSEWWDYQKTPDVPKEFKKVIRLQTDNSWYPLSEIQAEDYAY